MCPHTCSRVRAPAAKRLKYSDSRNGLRARSSAVRPSYHCSVFMAWRSSPAGFYRSPIRSDTLARPEALVKKSDDRILTTHVGSIPRPAALRELLVRQDRGEAVDEAALARGAEGAVGEIVRRQLEAGVDIGNDGEQPRAGFSTYVARRMRGFGRARRPPGGAGARGV